MELTLGVGSKMALRITRIVRQKYRRFEAKATFSKDDLSPPTPAQATKAALYHTHAQLEKRIDASRRLEFLKSPEKNWKPVEVDQGAQSRVRLEPHTKPTKKVNVGLFPQARAHAQTGVPSRPEAPGFDRVDLTASEHLFDVEQFTERDFEFLDEVKKSRPRLRAILQAFRRYGAVVERGESLGSRNPSQTIFFAKKVVNLESRDAPKSAVKRLMPKSEVERFLDAHAEVKKATVCRL